MKRIALNHRVFGSSVAAMLGVIAMTATCAAAPSQEEVFKSISENVGDTTDSRAFLIVICVVVGFVLMLVLFNQRKQRVVSPKTLHHHGKLLKEVARSLPLRAAEIKQLRILAEESVGPNGEPVSSPLSLLLCPSILAAAAQNRATRANRNVLAAIRKKIVR